MRLIIRFTCLLAGLLAVAPLLSPAQTSTNRGVGVAPSFGESPLGGFHLLAIGINGYVQWPQLKTAVNDARSVATVLQEQYDFPKQNVHTLYDAQATRANIIAQLRELARTLQPDDSLFIFYAGHGHLDDITQEGSWIPVEAGREDASTWLRNSEIKSYLRAMKARHVLLVSDSCFAGDFFQEQRAGLPAITDEYVRRAFSRTSRQALTSGGKEPVLDTGDSGHSVFTYYMLKHLRENRSPYLLPTDLWNRVKDGVTLNAKQTPALGNLRDTTAELGGEFVFFRKGVSGSLDAAIEQKKAQMTLLEQREEEAKKAQAAQQAVLDAKAQEMAMLDEQIAAMQKKLGSAVPVSGEDVLTQLALLADQKKAQAEELAALRRKAEQEKRDREAEIARLKEEENKKRKAAFDADYAKYLKVRDSEYLTPEIKQQAWAAICERWNVTARSVAPGALYWENSLATDETQSEREARLAAKEAEQNRRKLAQATKDDPWVNSLGMKFVPMPGTEVLLSIWETRVKDYRAYASASSGVERSWQSPGFEQTDEHPVVNVSWDDAKAFCSWLSKKEGVEYRLATDWEWSVAVGLSESRSGSPKSKDEQIKNEYPWGTQWPPPNGAGNYCGEETQGRYGSMIGNYRDGYAETSPVGRFAENRLGILDLGGNVREWCEDYYDGQGGSRVLRGASWVGNDSGSLLSSRRLNYGPSIRSSYFGFRVVVVVGSAAR